ncbi:MAG TPA: helix-turn-helix transcriptional regulator [Bacillales bacterium]|nr:helix-turn-helix transcriptional regulator [Bacillales bacterium]
MKLNAETLRKIRIAYKLTQYEMAALCGCTAGMINKVERNKYPLTEKIRRAIDREFQLTPDKLAILLAEYDRIMERKTNAKQRGA